MWASLIPVILQYGVPFAEKVWQKWSSGNNPTQADWDELKALGKNTARSQMLDALSRAGIALDDPKAVALLAQVPA